MPNNDDNKTLQAITGENNPQDTKNKNHKKFIEDNNFEKLIKMSNEVFEVTSISPSVSKIINLIIEQADLENIKNQLIQKLK